MKTAIITGVLGMDGSYLAELLLDRNYKVVGTHRRSSNPNIENVADIIDNSNFSLRECDITDYSCISGLIDDYTPDEIYNLGAQSHVHTSFGQPIHTMEVNAIGTLNWLEAIRHSKNKNNIKFYQASTSEMFGSNFDIDENGTKYQDENTKFCPQSPYGVAKLAAYNLCRIYKQSYNIFSCSGILFNHESPRRSLQFVTRKITNYVAKLSLGLTNEKLSLGNLDAIRDWGHSKDYVRAMYLMMQADKPEDYVICTGKSHTVRELCQLAFDFVQLDYNQHITVSQDLKRPSEVDFLQGNNNKAYYMLGWEPTISFRDMIYEMINNDIKKLR